MANWDELFKSDDFNAYRRKQAEQVGMYIERLVKSSLSGEYNVDEIKGAMHMARLLIDLPEKITDSDGMRAVLRDQKIADYADLTSFLVRRHLIQP